MDSLLQHVIAITAHRDHAMVARAVVAALHSLTGSRHVRLLDFVSIAEGRALKQKAWLQDGAALSADEKSEWEQVLEDIDLFPGLAEGLAARRSVIEHRNGRESRYMLWLPIWLNDKLVSCIEIGGEQKLCPQTCAIAEGILNVYRNYQSLLDYSERDSLTGLFNRKTFDEKFTKMATLAELAALGTRADRSERRRPHQTKEQWLAVIDIDHFKKVNDQYGHLYGDEVLILVANLLKSSFRPYDRIFRFGGEEFVVLLRAVTYDNAYRIFERFRQRVEEYSFPQIGRITVSLGFVRIGDNTPVVILGRADQALYYAKAHGRNRVCFYDELVTEGFLQPENSVGSVEFF